MVSLHSRAAQLGVAALLAVVFAAALIVTRRPQISPSAALPGGGIGVEGILGIAWDSVVAVGLAVVVTYVLPWLGRKILSRAGRS